MYRSFREMPVWKSAMQCAEDIFTLSESLPRKEDYGLTSQIRRSTLSISANIAEAFGRQHIFDKIRFYYIARGSATETQSHLEYGKRVGYFPGKKANEIAQTLQSIIKNLNKLIIHLRTDSTKPKPKPKSKHAISQA